MKRGITKGITKGITRGVTRGVTRGMTRGMTMPSNIFVGGFNLWLGIQFQIQD
jgi:hypothetical protein